MFYWVCGLGEEFSLGDGWVNCGVLWRLACSSGCQPRNIRTPVGRTVWPVGGGWAWGGILATFGATWRIIAASQATDQEWELHSWVSDSGRNNTVPKRPPWDDAQPTCCSTPTRTRGRRGWGDASLPALPVYHRERQQSTCGCLERPATVLPRCMPAPRFVNGASRTGPVWYLVGGLFTAGCSTSRRLAMVDDGTDHD